MYKPFVWEYSRLNMTHAVMSKRKLAQLVAGGYVSGWDDPRMLTLSGMRRRGITPAVSKHFECSLGSELFGPHWLCRRLLALSGMLRHGITPAACCLCSAVPLDNPLLPCAFMLIGGLQANGAYLLSCRRSTASAKRWG